MEYLKQNLISKGSAETIVNSILSDKESWVDGKKTAGSQAAKVKRNLQLSRDSYVSKLQADQVAQEISNNDLLKSFCLPKSIHGLMFTRTGIGDSYGMHVDNPYMSSGRSDLSFTLFLNEKDEYEGGNLCIQTMQDVKKIKLNAGQIVIYPSTSLHAVEPVTKGERIVCIGWIQSHIKSSEDRNLLFNLNAGARGILAAQGRSDELDLIFQAYSNLIRRLGD
ncbi:Fe2+-dependent dioxygenase [Prochlorococcus sp. MIT 1300]|uniref:Fe2+-dependent dioxygenase n=1 Tax=Prochlorococcus sp. MIT 1300 TaxID=3096218 RepID=UPI002A74F5C5|nr:Fe2+-dependent dioxygenase [Prochlorococcus sp. MIT 1300]